jgi:hypothetical protein
MPPGARDARERERLARRDLARFQATPGLKRFVRPARRVEVEAFGESWREGLQAVAHRPVLALPAYLVEIRDPVAKGWVGTYWAGDLPPFELVRLAADVMLLGLGKMLPDPLASWAREYAEWRRSESLQDFIDGYPANPDLMEDGPK